MKNAKLSIDLESVRKFMTSLYVNFMLLERRRVYDMLVIVVISGTVLFFSGCGAPKHARGKTKHSLKLEQATNALYSGRDYQWFEGKARLKINTDDMKVGVSTTIRLQKDSLIWISISKFGFEMARALITPDSAFIIDRFNREYYAKSINEYLAEYHVPFGFREMQDLIVGLPVAIESKNFAIESRDELWVLQATDKTGLQGRYLIQYASPVRFLECIITDPRKRSFTARFSNYKICSNCTFETPYERQQIVVSEHGRQVFDLSFSEITLNQPVPTPFAVPNRYTTYD